MGLWRRKDALDLERALRAGRPEAPRELVEGIARKIAGERRSSGRKLRLGVAVGLSAAMFAVLGAFGGLSYAANGVSHAVSSAVHVIAPVKPAKLVSIPNVAYSSSMAQYNVALCLHGINLNVNTDAAAGLLAAGATQGACKAGAFKPGQKLVRMCFKGQNVNISDAGLIAAKSRLDAANRALAKARGSAAASILAKLQSKRDNALTAYNNELKKLKTLHVTPGFCKVTSS